ncbi:MAG: rRNA adenine N-6-methyltransferase family protein [Pseudomonadota bacterium]|nr:rRNA adenine N-6-methyltransferase family protein [Pseudomonadota bacterium]|tara:strand:+ start:19459 stop:20121 length:663 start_codon:yes stop_codon:yes gene_type:complete
MDKVSLDVEKDNMINGQLKALGIDCPNTLSCLSKIRREDFAPSDYKALSYSDIDIPINSKYSMIKPTYAAKILQQLKINNSSTVLEIGTGSGYLTACLSYLSKHVDTIDIDKKLLISAEKRLKKLLCSNISFFNEDIFSKWQPKNKYNFIVVNGSVLSRISKLENFLEDNGKMFIVIGEYPFMQGHVIEKVQNNKFLFESVFEIVLDPLSNQESKKDFIF